MREKKWTPGPWIVEFHDKSAEADILGPRVDGDTRPIDGLGSIVRLDLRHWLEDENIRFAPQTSEQRANARLIAAAPELAETLNSDLLNQLLGHIEDVADGKVWDICQAFMERRDLVLRKAYGES